jgi:serine/threonine-protein kinase HipA
VAFSYAPGWLEKYNQPISLSLPCGEERFNAQKSTAFFDNLLPEEGMYTELCREARIDGASGTAGRVYSLAFGWALS